MKPNITLIPCLKKENRGVSQTISGETEYFTLQDNGIERVSEVRFNFVSPIPSKLTYIGSENTTLDSVGTTIQLSVSASCVGEEDEGVTFRNL